MKIGVWLFVISVLLFPVVCIAEGGEEYVGELIVMSHHDTTDASTPPDYYRDIAFDDNGRMYGLRRARFDIYTGHGAGKTVKAIRFENPLAPKDLPSQIEVSADGSRIYIIIRGGTYVFDVEGRLIGEAAEGLGTPIRGRLAGGITVDWSRNWFDRNMNVMEWSTPTWFVDSKGNYFEFYGGPIIKHAPDCSVIWDIDFDRYSVIGMDAEDNIYLLRGTFSIDKDVRKVDPDGNVIEIIDLIPKEAFFSNESFNRINPYPDLPFTPEIPNVRVFVISDGSIYQWFDYSMLSKKQTEAWLMSGEVGGKYIIFKYSKSGSEGEKAPNNIIAGVSEYYKSNHYSGNTRVYDLANLVESAAFSPEGQKLFIRALRNEIFARHGRIFKSEDLNAIFESTKWYKPNQNYSDDVLNDIENKNIQFILDYEKNMGWR